MYEELQALCQRAHDIAQSKGFWNIPDTEDVARVMELKEAVSIGLIGTEVAEAMEAHRKGDRENLGEEFADIVIRVADLCGHMGIDLGVEIEAKMARNEQRPKLHGKKY